VKAITLPWRDSYGEARQLLLLGVSFMGAGLVLTLSNYLIRVVMLRQFNMADVGIYQAAFNLSGILVGFVLGAMGADYYPRLTAAAGSLVPRASLVNVTVAPGTTPPCASFTVPDTAPVVIWAKTGTAAHSSNTSAEINPRTHAFFTLHLRQRSTRPHNRLSGRSLPTFSKPGGCTTVPEGCQRNV
ncbi:MAG: hypothetical protein ABI818_17405, partial [Acidobacteriota bacterium]